MTSPLTSSEIATLFPWEVWMDGKWHQAVHHRDFHQEIAGFVSMLRRRGQGCLLEVETRVRGAVVYFRFYVSEAPLDRRGRG